MGGVDGDVFLEFADIGEKAPVSAPAFVPGGSPSEPVVNDIGPHDFDNQRGVIGMLEDEAAAPHGERGLVF